jgi:indolepyruvate ferredoxin oxidoreductase beta subunit
MTEILKLAIYAVGGQGGGVLTGWIEALARDAGWACQATSVAGVSQRTGATIYYIEMARTSGHQPVFSLMPVAGDVDVMIAAEWMEAGRAIIRGFVTPDRTTLIASTHRNLAVSEKIVPGDGIADADAVREAAQQMARRLIAADFEAAALREGSVISAALFGALAGSGALPFPPEAYAAVIRAGGRGTEASLRAFAVGFAGVTEVSVPPAPMVAAVRGPEHLLTGWRVLEARAAALPGEARDMALAGLRKVVDFQDLAYGGEYLDRVARVHAVDLAPWEMTRDAAKYIANAMAYDDVIRVADLKSRAVRLERIKGEMGASGVMQLTEFLHPRGEEIVGLFPRRFGAWVKASPARMRRLDGLVNRGRRVRTDRVGGYLSLYLLGGLRRWRRGTLRHHLEMEWIEDWLARVLAEVSTNPLLALEILRFRRLVKGYSDTHARGMSKYDRVLAAIDLVRHRKDAADWARRLREAALQDEAGKALDGAIQTIEGFLAEAAPAAE